MLSEYITSLADVSFHIVSSMYVRFRYSGKNLMRFAVFWRISVRFCGFRTPLTPPSFWNCNGYLRRGWLLFNTWGGRLDGCLFFFIYSFSLPLREALLINCLNIVSNGPFTKAPSSSSSSSLTPALLLDKGPICLICLVKRPLSRAKGLILLMASESGIDLSWSITCLSAGNQPTLSNKALSVISPL